MKGKLRITIFGDICPTDDNRDLFLQDDPKVLFGDVLEETAKADIVLANLECTLTDKPTLVKKAGPVLYAPHKTAKILKTAGIDSLSLANNHIRDCGDAGVVSTVEACSKNGIRTYGVGRTQEEVRTPLILERKGWKIGVISFAEREFNCQDGEKFGANPFDPFTSLSDIADLEKQVDYVIVQYHGGIEHYELPSPLLQKKCRAMVDAGADIVLCQHSHCVGSHEQYNGGEILYGQGNSIFGYRKGNGRWNHGLLTNIELDDETVKIDYLLMETKENGSIGLAGSDSDVILDFESYSMHLSDPIFIKKSWKIFCKKQECGYLPLLYGWSVNANRLNRILKGIITRCLYTQRQLNVTHNLIRCDAHREVLETILSEYDFK